MRKRSTMMVSAAALAVGGLLGAPATAAADAPPSPQLQRKAPVGAPNVVIVLLDDVGFGASSTFGGPVATPALDQLARIGLRYNRFHTTAMCSPTRASLLTGRNPHATGIGAVMNAADPRPGYTGFHGKDTATVAEILRQNGYGTAAFGKWHQTPDWENSQSGPFDRWPTGEGFEKFYGFIGAETEQFDPALFDGTTPILRPAKNDYHLTEDLVDHSIGWIRSEQSLNPAKPFFLYLAPGATHAPLQVPKRWSDPYRGKFAQGWDKLREETWRRQLELGVIPKGTQLTPRPEGLLAWDALTKAQKASSERLMEVYAGFLAHTDAQVGRLIDELKKDGTFDNTIFFYIVGDNGASGEGQLLGSINHMRTLQGVPESDEDRVAKLDDIGTGRAYAQYNSEWAWAMDTPFQYTKTIASHLGGTRNPLVVSWPGHIKDQGGLRSQFGHVNDIVPTILEAAGIQTPEEVNGIRQKPMNGISLAYSFTAPTAPERHKTQYFEIYGNRAIYHDGWMASAMHGKPSWTTMPTISLKPFDEDVWELYDLRSDYSQAHDLAASKPDKLKEMKDIFMAEAARNQVLPLAAPLAAREGKAQVPTLAAGRAHFTFYPGMVGIPGSMMRDMFNRSWTITAALSVDQGANGVVAANGGIATGWSLFVDDQRRPVFSYSAFDVQTVRLVGQPLPVGQNKLRVDFDYDGGGRGKGGQLRLIVNDKDVASDRLKLTPAYTFSFNESLDIGKDLGSAAAEYPKGANIGYAFTGGSIAQVEVDLR